MEEKKDLQVVIQEVEAHYEDSLGTEERISPQGKHNSKDNRNTPPVISDQIHFLHFA